MFLVKHVEPFTGKKILYKKCHLVGTFKKSRQNPLNKQVPDQSYLKTLNVVCDTAKFKQIFCEANSRNKPIEFYHFTLPSTVGSNARNKHNPTKYYKKKSFQ
jgi:hypothetical protein